MTHSHNQCLLFFHKTYLPYWYKFLHNFNIFSAEHVERKKALTDWSWTIFLKHHHAHKHCIQNELYIFILCCFFQVTHPFELLGMESGYQYICVMVDYLTKWPQAYPLRTKTAAEVTECIVKSSISLRLQKGYWLIKEVSLSMR